MTVFSNEAFDDHRIVHFINDPKGNLRGIIALHRVSPRAAGGIRMKQYATEDAALNDALRLSRAMSYKWAFAGLERGGGKTVILGDSNRDKTVELLHAVGRAIDKLGGIYYAGSDVGTSAEDMRIIQQVTPYVRGADPDHGDSSAATAYGVLQGIRAAAKWTLKRESLEGVTFAIQGVGHVGAELCRLLSELGAKLIVADVDTGAIARVVKDYGAMAVGVKSILSTDADILAPCALGGVIDLTAAQNIKAKAICGGANNQLSADNVAAVLQARGILFVPDYVVNSGGIINGIAEGPDYDRARVWAKLDTIYPRALEVFELAAKKSLTSVEAADLICQPLIAARG